MDKRRFAVLSAGHFVNDIYEGSLPALLPFLIPSLGLSLPAAALLMTVHQAAASVIQPVLGHMADRSTTRIFSFAGTAAMAIGISLLGVAPEYSFLVILVAIAGLGTASFHPQTAALANSLSGGRRGMAMSAYLTAGIAGSAFGPIIVVLAVTALGLGVTPLLAIPGLVSALLLALYAPTNRLRSDANNRPSLRQLVTSKWPVISGILGVATFRTATTIGLVTFLPLLFQARGYPGAVWGSLLTVFLLSGTLGSLAGGYLSDLIGRRQVIVILLLLSVAAILGVLQTDGILLWLMTALAGATIQGCHSILTVKAQELLPDNVGMASGLIIGFSSGIGALSLGPISLLADSIGISQALGIVAFLPLLSIVAAIALPEPGRRRGLTETLRVRRRN